MNMKQKVLGGDIAPKCAYCGYGIQTADKTVILCEKKGITSHDSSCKKFLYDPLKRIPERPIVSDFNEQDFSL